MRLRPFRAATTAEALAQIRAELGPDAIILGTRRVAGGGVECTAAVEDWACPVGDGTQTVTKPAHPPALPASGGNRPLLDWHGLPPPLAERLASGPLAAAFAASFAFAPLPLAGNGPPLLLLGPPGAGKTLTVARLATRLVLAGRRPTVITADGRRAGAAEELAAYTRLLGLDLVVATSPAALSRALARRPPGEAALIDSEGANPFDPAARNALAAMLAASGATGVLAVPAGGDVAETAEIAAAFAGCGARFLLPTRLDLARRLGGVLAAAAATGLPFTEAGTGTGAADSLVPVTASFLAERLSRPVPADLPMEPAA